MEKDTNCIWTLAEKDIEYIWSPNGVKIAYSPYTLHQVPVKRHKFGGYFDINGQEFYIQKVIYSNPATVVFWSDDTTTVCKCSPEDTYSKETGLAICIFKKLAGGKEVRKIFNDWLPEKDENIVYLKDVRRRNRK